MDRESYIKMLENEIKLLKSEMKTLKTENEYLKRDHLTKAYNRYYLDEMMEMVYKPKMDKGWFFKICLIDLNNLHDINRLYGYEAGDKLILDVCNSIKRQAEEQGVSGTLYRIGGDEFIYIFQPYDNFNLKLENATVVCGEINSDKDFRQVFKELDSKLIAMKNSRN